MNLFAEFLMNMDWAEIRVATEETLLMTFVSLFFTVVLGIPLGVFLFLTRKGQLLASPKFYFVLSLMTNMLRALPFVILLIAMIPLTILITGTSIGVAGVIPALVVGSTPLLARLVEMALNEVSTGIIEAMQSMGATTKQIVWRGLLPEAMPGILSGIFVTAVALISYSAMAGLVGGGGLGDLAVRNGYQRFQTDVMVVTILVLLAMVQLVQSIGDYLVRYYSRKGK